MLEVRHKFVDEGVYVIWNHTILLCIIGNDYKVQLVYNLDMLIKVVLVNKDSKW